MDDRPTTASTNGLPSMEGIAVPGLRFRRFGGDADVEGMARVLQVAAGADGLDWYTTAEDLANELGNAPNEDPGRDAVVAEVEGRIVAFGRASWAIRDDRHVYHTAGEVDPAVRRRGVGRAILRAEQARLREIAADHVEARQRILSSEVIEGQAGALALLSSDGYSPVRWFSEMARPLAEPIAPRELPPGLELRPVRVEDHRRIFAAEGEAFRDHWGHREWTETDFRWAFGSPAIDTSLWRVAWAGDEVAGVVATYVYARENEQLGIRRAWLERVSVRRPWRQRGVASALMLSAMGALRERGFETAVLAVDADNPNGAVGVYERIGFRRVRGGTILERPMEPATPDGAGDARGADDAR